MTKTVLISGAGGALAASVAEVFAEADWRLALIAHSASSQARLEARYPDSLVVRADLSDDAEAQRAVKSVLEHYGEVGALLTLAGGFAMSGATETGLDELEQQLDLNFRTAFNTTRALLPHLLSRGEGVIVGIGARPAQGGAAKMGAYAASKAALVTYLESVRAELAPKGVWASLLYPMGTIDTPANRESMPKTDPETWIDPRELAESALHLVTRGARGRIRELRVYPPA